MGLKEVEEYKKLLQGNEQPPTVSTIQVHYSAQFNLGTFFEFLVFTFAPLCKNCSMGEISIHYSANHYQSNKNNTIFLIWQFSRISPKNRYHVT